MRDELSSEPTPLLLEDQEILSRAMAMLPSAESIPRSRVQETLSLGRMSVLMKLVMQLLFGVIKREDYLNLALFPKNLTPSISELLVGSPSVKLLPRFQRG